MRAAPAFQVTLSRFGVWRGGVWALAGAAALALAAWTAAQPAPPGVGQSIAVALATGLVLALGGWLARVPVATLRWDGQAWWMARTAAAEFDACGARRGELRVMMDLGAWMLLRFRPDATGWNPRAVTWLPAQRRGLEAEWHGLRCAVHSPRPAPVAVTPP
jgi:hypothetical protein